MPEQTFLACFFSSILSSNFFTLAPTTKSGQGLKKSVFFGYSLLCAKCVQCSFHLQLGPGSQSSVGLDLEHLDHRFRPHVGLEAFIHSMLLLPCARMPPMVPGVVRALQKRPPQARGLIDRGKARYRSLFSLPGMPCPTRRFT